VTAHPQAAALAAGSEPVAHLVDPYPAHLEALGDVGERDLLGVQAFWQEIAKGCIILLAVLFDVWVTRTSAAAATKK
jgi:hypothetical protein